MMDAKYLAEIKAREQVATPGPWEEKTNRHPQCNGEPWGWISGASGNITWSGYVGKTNADFIAHARTDIPELTAEVERLKKSNELFSEENHTLYQQISTLKKALEMAAEHINRLTKESDCRMKPNSEYCTDTISCIDCIQRRFICQAQEQEGRNEP